MECMGRFMYLDIDDETTFYFRLGNGNSRRPNNLVLAFHSSTKCYNQFEMD